MSFFWPHWQRPLFLVILPVIIWLMWKLWHTHQINGAWQKIIPINFQPWLLSGNSAQESALPKIILTMAVLLAFLALLGPSWQHIEQPPLKVDSPLVIVLDLTPKMLANDIPPSRLQSAKRKVLDIIKARKDAQTAVIVYSNTAHILVPLSDDQATIANLLAYISPEIMPSIGQRADLAIAKAIKLLANTQQINEGQILLVTTSLSDAEQTAINQLLANHPIALNILGVGTSQGAPIASSTGGFIKDSKGQIILPKLEAATLKNFAYSNKGHYSTITLNNNDIQILDLSNVKNNKRHFVDTEKRTTDYWQDQGYWLLLPLLALAALAARKGWLCCLPLLLLAVPPQSAKAFEWQKLWLNNDQQGQHLLQEHKPKEAAKRFQNKQWQGYSFYEDKDYSRAEKIFANETSADGIYNYANSLARQGKYQEAIAQWNKAINAKPNFTQAIKNKQLVEALLKKQQQQNPNSQPATNKQDNKGSGQSAQQQQNEHSSDNQPQPSQQPQGSSSQTKEQQQQGQQPTKTNDQQDQPVTSSHDDTTPNRASHQTNQAQQHNQQQTQNDSVKQNQAKELEHSAPNQPSATDNLQQEQNESLQQWLRTIPDDPSELLRRKFYYEQSYKGDN